MLTSEQLTELNVALCQNDLPKNPLLCLMAASKKAQLPFEDVLDHLIRQAIAQAHTRLASTDEAAPSTP